MSSPSRHSHAAVFLRSIYILLQCFFHHRMENMCNRNIKQFHLPKSQLQPEKQREVIKDCSFHFKCTGLPTLIPAVNRKWFAKKQIATLNTYKKHLEWSILLTWIHIHLWSWTFLTRISEKFKYQFTYFFIWFFTQRTLSIYHEPNILQSCDSILNFNSA